MRADTGRSSVPKGVRSIDTRLSSGWLSRSVLSFAFCNAIGIACPRSHVQLRRNPFQRHRCPSPQSLCDADFSRVALLPLRHLCARPAQLVQIFIQDAPRLFIREGFLVLFTHALLLQRTLAPPIQTIVRIARRTHHQSSGNPFHRHQRLLPQAHGDYHFAAIALGPFRQAGFLPPRSSVVNVSQEKNRMPPVCGLGVGVIA